MGLRNLRRPLALQLLGALILTATAWAQERPTDNYVLNLYDAFGEGGDGLTHDFGFSMLVRYEGRTILFDTGTDAGILQRNCEALGVDLATVDYAVISHNHPDHFSGVSYLRTVNPDVTIYLPPDGFMAGHIAFNPAGPHADAMDGLPREQLYFGGDTERMATGIDSSGFLGRENVVVVTETTEIEPGVSLVMTRSEAMGYFIAYPPNEERPVLVGLPEISLVLDTPEGAAVLVGCSHPAIGSIVAQARTVSDDIGLVAGGFHLIPHGEAQIRDVAAQLRDEHEVERVAPAHCTGHLAFRVFREEYGDAYQFAGLGSWVALSP